MGLTGETLKERPTNVGEACFACQREGRRSYYCDTMIIVAQRLSSFFNPAFRRTKTRADCVLLVLLAVQYEVGKEKTR